jgi:hypothetical protein
MVLEFLFLLLCMEWLRRLEEHKGTKCDTCSPAGCCFCTLASVLNALFWKVIGIGKNALI